MAIPVAFVAG